MSNENQQHPAPPAPTDNPNRPPARDYSALPSARIPGNQGLDPRAELRAYIAVECFPGRLAMSTNTSVAKDKDQERRDFAAGEAVKDADAILAKLKL